jgi:UDP-N-acetylglucosamine--N-acetylmuramyl-(pentapeptide) pyrophosphoryl-undecaprenol N-acetylglucosamine transferase
MVQNCLIAAGGTGGHMFPARAAADVLIARGWDVKLITDERGAKHASDFPGEPVAIIDASSPFVKNPFKLAPALWKLAKGYGQAQSVFREFKPDIVAGFGGYPAFPALAAARLSGLPYIIHEQNAVLGRVNRLFTGGAKGVASGFQRLDRLAPDAVHHVTGNPVRQAILDACADPFQLPKPGEKITVLVLGGSLGARILSESVPAAIASLPTEITDRLFVIQQTRAEALDAAQNVYDEAGIACELSPFFSDMGSIYARSHLIISRAGASSVSEIAAIGRPAIFVPLAIAMDDHQTANAEGLVEAGAALSISESQFTPEHLTHELTTLLQDEDRLGQLAKVSHDLGRKNAHNDLADLIEQSVEKN